jgi:hypothetical protein
MSERLYRLIVNLRIPNKKEKDIEVSLESNSFQSAVWNAIQMVLAEEKLDEEYEEYLIVKEYQVI